MKYNYRFINRQIEPNSVSYRLIITNTDTMEDIIFEKSFKNDLKEIDDEFLRKEANTEIKKIMDDELNSLGALDGNISE